eukprot:TRINITY_DN30624_c0_g1_i1.p1 TRINITY_DN30624_c0_g1~~TRINITY_DN30624_c0_g1_i1.p1  ORF type:complete len:433 (+),score=51.54 TRINITY_DN30624_c0_g1_i1:47-1300(+)
MVTVASAVVMGSTSCLPDEDDEALQSLLALVDARVPPEALPSGWDKESALRRLSEHLQAVDAEISNKAKCLDELDSKTSKSQEAEPQVTSVIVAAAVANARSSDLHTPRPVSSVSASTPVLIGHSRVAKALSASQPSMQGPMPAGGAPSMCDAGALNPTPVQEVSLSTPRCRSQPPFGEKCRFVNASSIAPSATSSSSPGATVITAGHLVHTHYQQHQVHRLASAPVGWQGGQFHGHGVALARQRASSPQQLGGVTYISSSAMRNSSGSPVALRSSSIGRCGAQAATPSMLLRGSMNSSMAGYPQNPMLAYTGLRETSPDARTGYVSPPMPSQGPVGPALGQQTAAVGAHYQGRFAVVPPAATPARSSATQQSWNPSPSQPASTQAGSRFVLVSPADRPMTPRRSNSRPHRGAPLQR